MGSTIIAVSRTPAPDTTSPGRNRPGQPRIVTCRYLRRNNQQCTAEAADPTADVVLCARHTALVIEHVRAAAGRELGHLLDGAADQVNAINARLAAAVDHTHPDGAHQ